MGRLNVKRSDAMGEALKPVYLRYEILEADHMSLRRVSETDPETGPETGPGLLLRLVLDCSWDWFILKL